MTMAKEPAGDDPRPVTRDPDTNADAKAAAPGADDDTHTAALQGAAGGGAASASAGYATGLMTGSEDDIGMRDIPDDDADDDADGASMTPGPPDAATPQPG
jgi:hypothetical protein